MKKNILALCALVLFLPVVSFAAVSARDNGYQEKINAYNVEATLTGNASIVVNEEIVYDFGTNEKHGIFRYVPTVYTGRKGSPRQSISKISVTDATGKRQSFVVSFSGNSEVIKVGDENDLVSGVRTYKIGYTLNHVISSNPDGDRFRWDAIGTGWTVPMRNVAITLKNSVKQVVNQKTLQCFVGATGSTKTCDVVKTGDTTRVSLASLGANDGVTLDALFARGTFPAPSQLELFIWNTPWYYALPLIALILFSFMWFKQGRGSRGRGTIVPIYEAPKDITPYEASIILEDMISRKALPAAIIELAIKGYIKIHRTEERGLLGSKTSYELELLKPLPPEAMQMEAGVANLFFIGRNTVNLNDLGDSFAQLNASLHMRAYQEVKDKGYYRSNPILSRILFLGLAAVLFVLGLLAATYFLVPAINYLAFILPGLLGFAFAFAMSSRTKAGTLKKEELLGLKLYIKTAEIDRIKFHDAPEKSPEKFEELLPYAILFGLEKKWADEFKDVYKNAPSWYDGNLGTFSALVLINDLNTFSNTAINAAISSSASAASGGFGGVGGGAGGGGGGSW